MKLPIYIEPSPISGDRIFSDVLARDGAGSGLDADTLDGVDAAGLMKNEGGRYERIVWRGWAQLGRDTAVASYPVGNTDQPFGQQVFIAPGFTAPSSANGWLLGGLNNSRVYRFQYALDLRRLPAGITRFVCPVVHVETIEDVIQYSPAKHTVEHLFDPSASAVLVPPAYVRLRNTSGAAVAGLSWSAGHQANLRSYLTVYETLPPT